MAEEIFDHSHQIFNLMRSLSKLVIPLQLSSSNYQKKQLFSLVDRSIYKFIFVWIYQVFQTCLKFIHKYTFQSNLKYYKSKKIKIKINLRRIKIVL